MEEPENGIHPANLPAILRLVEDLAVDPDYEPDEDHPFRQVIVNTHSPGVVQLCDLQDLLLAEVNAFQTAEGVVSRALSLLPYRGTWRALPGAATFSEADMVPYLAAPQSAQLHLPLDLGLPLGKAV
jgi:hypothetical protein